MNHALTLVADRTSTTLSPALIAQVREAVQGGAPDILSPGEAADIPVHAMPDMAVVYAALGDAAVNVISAAVGRQPGGGMDGTAVMVVTVDDGIPPAVLAALVASPDFFDARAVSV